MTATQEKRFVVLTTILRPTEAVRRFAALPGWQVVVVGDLKTPSDWRLPGVTYLGPQAQRDLFPGLAERLPWNHYARKNLGYLYAMSQGADVIADTDDDNAPLPGWETSVPPPMASLPLVTSPPVANIYRLFTDEPIWPRGLPLDLVLSNEEIAIESAGPQRVLALQGLVDGEPDVDAIYRLTAGRPVRFRHRDPVVLNEGVFAPSNSQNTLWRRQAFPFLYLPSFVTFRFTDILRGWVAQRCLWTVGGRMAFGPATAIQERNPHNLLRDFESEIPCYLQSGPAIAALRALRAPAHPADTTRACYEILEKVGITTTEETRLAHAWAQAACEAAASVASPST
ncbi:MAG TPA: STELLO glycosyltransferase family protein [Candidatus Brocadiia bacterium]|nr:STELLO glycosyltransferase family protein [Candidatus Brocadiia bacterium]